LNKKEYESLRADYTYLKEDDPDIGKIGNVCQNEPAMMQKPKAFVISPDDPEIISSLSPGRN
jgi:hypothetical protein